MAIKVLHVITGLNVGGAEKALLRNVPLLKKFEHAICSLSEAGEIGSEFRSLGYRLYTLKSGKKFTPAAVWKFRRIIKTERPDIIITYLLHADIFGRIFGRLFGVKKIICYPRSALDKNKYLIHFLAERLTSFLVSEYIAVSNTVKQVYIKKAGISPDKIAVIPNGIDINKYTEPRDSSEIKQKLGITGYSPVIGCVARLSPEKNHEQLIGAFADYSLTKPTAVLLLIGDGPEKEVLLHQVKNLGIENRVLFLGNRIDVPELLSTIDIFILLSDYEGMSNAILEAIASGCAIIASDIEANRELIKNEYNGFLINPRDTKSVVQKIQSLADNPQIRETFKKNSLTKIKEFSLDASIAKLSDEIDKIAKP